MKWFCLFVNSVRSYLLDLLEELSSQRLVSSDIGLALCLSISNGNLLGSNGDEILVRDGDGGVSVANGSLVHLQVLQVHHPGVDTIGSLDVQLEHTDDFAVVGVNGGNTGLDFVDNGVALHFGWVGLV